MAMPVVPFPVIALLIVLVDFACDRSHTRSSSATDQGTLQAPSKQSAQGRTTRSADQSPLPGPNAALVAAIVVPAIRVIVVRMPASRAVVEGTSILWPSGLEGHRHKNQQDSTRNPSRRLLHIQSPGNSFSFDADRQKQVAHLSQFLRLQTKSRPSHRHLYLFPVVIIPYA